jgi:hypothetical protein
LRAVRAAKLSRANWPQEKHAVSGDANAHVTTWTQIPRRFPTQDAARLLRWKAVFVFAPLVLALELGSLSATVTLDHDRQHTSMDALTLHGANPVVARGPSAHVEITPVRKGSVTLITLKVTYDRDTIVRGETVTIDVRAAGTTEAVFRDGELHALGKVLHADAWSPKLALVRGA